MTHKDYKLAAVVFTDIVGFSKMMETDEKGTLVFLEYHNDLIRNLADEHRGRVIKTIGDAFLMDFPTALDAVSCAVAIQTGMRQYNITNSRSVALRIGVHLGDIYFYENDALGEGINIASRLQSASQPGTITISREVYNQVSGKIPLRVESLGQIPLKNISREVHAFRILSDAGPELAPSASRQLNAPASTPVPGGSFQELLAEWRRMRQNRPSPASVPQESSWFSRYKAKALAEIDKEAQGWWGHLFSYLGVNALLFYLNTRSGGFPWAMVTAWAWGIGLASHLASILSNRSVRRTLESAGELNETEGRELKKVLDNQKGLLPHIVSSLATSGFLIYLQTVTSGPAGFPWGWVAGGFMLLGVLGHIGAWLGFGKKRREWRERFKNGPSKVVQPTQDQDVPPKARELETSIRKLLAGINPNTLPWAQDLEPILDQYMVQIGKLARSEKEMSRILGDLALDDLGGQETKIQHRLEQARSDSLKQEYSRALELVRKQQRSREDLMEQHELISVKLDGAVQTLKQIQLDITRIQSTGGEGTESLRLLRKRSDELGNDLLDYTSSWQEIESSGV